LGDKNVGGFTGIDLVIVSNTKKRQTPNFSIKPPKMTELELRTLHGL